MPHKVKSNGIDIGKRESSANEPGFTAELLPYIEEYPLPVVAEKVHPLQLYIVPTIEPAGKVSASSVSTVMSCSSKLLMLSASKATKRGALAVPSVYVFVLLIVVAPALDFFCLKSLK